MIDDGQRTAVALDPGRGHPAQRRARRRVAFTATHFFTFESVQLKGVATRVEEATSADRIRFDRYCSGAAAAIAETDGTPIELVLRFITAGIYACTMTVEAVFDQTPGPRGRYAAGAVDDARRPDAPDSRCPRSPRASRGSSRR